MLYGLDKILYEIGQHFNALDWMEHGYGRAHLVYGAGGREPAVYVGDDKDYTTLQPDDRVKSFIFSYVPGRVRMDDFSQFAENSFTSQVELIFFGNLEEMFGQSNRIDTHFVTLLIMNELKKLNRVRVVDFTEQSPLVYGSFDLYPSTRYFMYPYSNIKFTLEVTGLEPCKNTLSLP